MANVSKKEFGELVDVVASLDKSHANMAARLGEAERGTADAKDTAMQAFEAALAHAYRKHPDYSDRFAALEARLATAEKAGDKLVADLSARVDGIEKAVTDRLIDKRCDEMSNGALAFCVDSLEARVAALSSRLDALARTVGSLAEKSHAHTLKNGDTIELTITAATEYDSKVWPVAPEKPTPPKPKCPWCGGEAVFDNNGLLSTRYRCTNTACLKVFWV
jgi:hypothetical protein